MLKIKLKFTLWQTTKVHSRVMLQLYSLFDLGARLMRWSTPRTGHFDVEEETRHPFYSRLCGPHSRSGRVRKISPPLGIDPWTGQTVGSRYTDCDTPPFPILGKVKYIAVRCCLGNSVVRVWGAEKWLRIVCSCRLWYWRCQSGRKQRISEDRGRWMWLWIMCNGGLWYLLFSLAMFCYRRELDFMEIGSDKGRQLEAIQECTKIESAALSELSRQLKYQAKDFHKIWTM